MPNSQTRKRSSSRAPRELNDLQWLANPYEQLKRSTSFIKGGVSDEEFFRFFEEIGEVASNRSPRNKTRSQKNTARKSPKKSPRASAGKSPKAAGKSGGKSKG
jgi:hypothetical protein